MTLNNRPTFVPVDIFLHHKPEINIMSYLTGILAALIAPLLMVVGFIIWDNHWIGSSFALNMYKCNLTMIGFAIVTFVGIYYRGNPVVGVFTLRNVSALMLSSTIGILIGDWVWLEGMRVLGAKKTIIMDSLKPFLAAYLGQVFFDEQINIYLILGLVLTVLGVGLVAKEQKNDDGDNPEEDQDAMDTPEEVETILLSENIGLLTPRESQTITPKSNSYAAERRQRQQTSLELTYGWFMAALNVVLHTFGAVLTKKFGVGLTTFEINFIRFGFAGIMMAFLSTFLSIHQQRKTVVDTATSNPWYELPKALSKGFWIRISIGVVFVSFLQPALTNYAMFQISLAMLLTLESIGPLYEIPSAYVMQGIQPTLRASLGAVLAVLGIIILSFLGEEQTSD